MSTVYLVDDHAMMRDGLRAVLEANGHTVVGESTDIVQALTELRALKPDILLLDLRLHDHSGLDLLKRLQHSELPTRTIVLTMSAQPAHVAEALRTGARGYVLKGAPAAELLGAINAVLLGRRHLGGAVADLAVQGLAEKGNPDTLGLDSLSMRERQVVELVVRGKSSAEIGQLLHLSPKTVETYRSRMMAKIGVKDVASLVRFAVRSGLISAEDC